MADSTAIDRLRQGLADVGDPPAFDDDELGALIDAVDGDLQAARRDGLRLLVTHMARFNDYSAGASQEKKSQIFDQLMRLYKDAQDEAGSLTGAAVGAGLLSPTVGVVNRVVW